MDLASIDVPFLIAFLPAYLLAPALRLWFLAVLTAVVPAVDTRESNARMMW
jgi:hypothetical protein